MIDPDTLGPYFQAIDLLQGVWGSASGPLLMDDLSIGHSGYEGDWMVIRDLDGREVGRVRAGEDNPDGTTSFEVALAPDLIADHQADDDEEAPR